MYDKKLFKKEIGLIGLIPVEERKYQVQVNGSKLKNARIKILDGTGKAIQEIVLSAQYSILSLSSLKKGDYILELNYKGVKQQVAIVL
jgi:hypothetical protein